MAYTQKTEGNSRWWDFKLEICFEWGTTGISIRPYTVFNIYINDLEDDISSKVLKFADGTKVSRKVTNDTDKQSLQDDLDKLVKWSEKYSFSQRVINEWNKLPNDCVNASDVNMFKNRIDRGRATHRWVNCWTLDKQMASLSTCHLELVVWDGNLVKFTTVVRKDENLVVRGSHMQVPVGSRWF